VSAGTARHAEAVEVGYDPATISYAELLAVFWDHIDPTTTDRQFRDNGTQYGTGILYLNKEQEQLAPELKRQLEQTKGFPESIVTEITAATVFHPAEKYHQGFLRK